MRSGYCGIHVEDAPLSSQCRFVAHRPEEMMNVFIFPAVKYCAHKVWNFIKARATLVLTSILPHGNFKM